MLYHNDFGFGISEIFNLVLPVVLTISHDVCLVNGAEDVIMNA